MNNKASLTDKPKNFNNGGKFKDLIDAGVFYGRHKSKTHPKMRQYTIVNRNSFYMINPESTLYKITSACEFIKDVVKNNGLLLFVGTHPPAIEAVKSTAEEFNFPFVNARWLGGTLTNFNVMLKRIEYYKKMKSDFEEGRLDKYTKKERLGFERQLKKLENTVGTLVNLNKIPDALVIIDPVIHKTALKEANRLNIPVISYANTDANPDEIAYLVPGNTRSKLSIEWFLGKIREAVKDGKNMIDIEGRAGKEDNNTGAMSKETPLENNAANG